MIGDWIEKVEYPQLPSMTEVELASFFEKAHFARLATINEDSTVHLAPIFFKYDNGQILMATQDPSRKNYHHHPNFSILTGYDWSTQYDPNPARGIVSF